MRISDWSSDVCSSDLRWFGVTDCLPNSNVVSTNCVTPSTRAFSTPTPTFSCCMAKRVSRTRTRWSSSRWRGMNRRSPSIARSEEHTSELQSLMRISYAVFCLKKKNTIPLKKQKQSHYDQQINTTTEKSHNI